MDAKIVGKREGNGWVLRLRVGRRWFALMQEKGSRAPRSFNRPEDCAKAARELSQRMNIDSTVKWR